MNVMLSIDCSITAAESSSVWYDAGKRTWALPVRGKGLSRHSFASGDTVGGIRAVVARSGGEPLHVRGTALHWACWKGYPDLVELLFAHGASLTVEDATFQGTPAGWLDHGRRNCHEGDGDYVQVEQMLRAAGAKMD